MIRAVEQVNIERMKGDRMKQGFNDNPNQQYVLDDPMQGAKD